MSLLFGGATSHRVDVGSGASLDNLNAFTILMWVYPTGLAAGDVNYLYAKDPGTFTNYTVFYADEPGFGAGTLVLDRNRGGGAYTDAAAFKDGAITNNKWWFVGGQLNTAGANSDQKLFTGDLTTVVTEVTGYDIQTVGSGTVANDAAASGLIGNAAGLTESFKGRIAWVGIWNRILSLGEIREQQRQPRKTSGCVLFTWLGRNGVGTQYDYSGNANHGTVTGATLSDPLPLRTLDPDKRYWYMPAWEAGGGGSAVKHAQHHYKMLVNA